jgi:serine/threonine-protein kinase
VTIPGAEPRTRALPSLSRSAARVGPWVLGERIGGGGQATVYLARHVEDGRFAAVKLIHATVWSDPAFRLRFRREREALAQLSHPGVVPVLGQGEHEGRGYLVMALARGGSLADRLALGPLDPPEALPMLAAIAGALDAAHAAGVLHRDVTPANVLLDPDGPWLGDFGVARRVDATTATGDGMLIGTAAYLAPEVIGGGRATAAADRYGLAAVAYECLTGHPPFSADGVPGLLYAHMHRTPPRPSSVRPGLPAALDGPLLAGLAKDPADRPPSAGALVGRIARAADPVAVTRQVVRPARRRRRILGPIALAGTSLLVVGAAGTALVLPRLGGDEAPPATTAPAVAPAPALTVPGPRGGEVAAGTPRADDLPAPIPAGAAAATVAGVRVVAFDGGWEALSATRDGLAGYGLAEEPITGIDGRTVGLRAGLPMDLVGLLPRYALLVLDEPGGPRAVVLYGSWEDVDAYVARLAGSGTIPPPER